ncbi:pyridoxal phosphate-dependent decarboxylase family protein [Spirochaeta dissipatitropha]
MGTDMSSQLALKELLQANNTIVDKILQSEQEGALFTTPDPRTALDSNLFPIAIGSAGLEEGEVLQRLDRIMAGTPSSSNWRFVNQLFGGRVNIAVAAELLAVIANSSMYTYKAAGSQVLIENEVLNKLLTVAGFPGGEGAFVPGGSFANMAAMIVARNQLFPEARDHGTGDSRAGIYTSEESHYSIVKNAGMLGLGRRNVRRIPVSSRGAMLPEALEAAVEADIKQGVIPMLVNATAGTTVRGAFDPIPELLQIARRHGMWLHVDGALGASLLLSRQYSSLLEGLASADSLSWNPHKMMGVPLQTSLVLFRQKGGLQGSLDETADYLFQSDEELFNPGRRSLQCGRRNDALRLWAAWAYLGDDGWDQRIQRQIENAGIAARMIAEDPDLILCEEPQSVNVCFQVKGRDSAEICSLLNSSGRLKIGYGQVKGQQAIRLVCINPELDEERIGRILGEIKSV